MAGCLGAARLISNQATGWGLARSPEAGQQRGLRAWRLSYGLQPAMSAEEELVRLTDGYTYERLCARTLETLSFLIKTRWRAARVMGQPA